MENYYFDLSRLPEKFNNDTVKKFMEQHKFHVYESSKAPKNKHIGSGAWHDDVIAFLEENAPVVDTTVKGEWLEAVHTDTPQPDESELKELSEFINDEKEVVAPPKKKKAVKKSEDSPNPTDNNGVA